MEGENHIMKIIGIMNMGKKHFDGSGKQGISHRSDFSFM